MFTAAADGGFNGVWWCQINVHTGNGGGEDGGCDVGSWPAGVFLKRVGS